MPVRQTSWRLLLNSLCSRLNSLKGTMFVLRKTLLKECSLLRQFRTALQETRRDLKHFGLLNCCSGIFQYPKIYCWFFARVQRNPLKTELFCLTELTTLYNTRFQKCVFRKYSKKLWLIRACYQC